MTSTLLLRVLALVLLAHLLFGQVFSQGHLGELALVQTISIRGNTYHVQGVEVAGAIAWITSVDRHSQRGFLFEVALPEGDIKRTVEIQDGDRFHPGGLSGDARSLWIPVAEYKRNSTSIIQQRNKITLEVEHQFSVSDHIGCIAVTDQGLIGANWDATDFYFWDRKGKLIRKVRNPTGNAFQDMKSVAGQLIGGGLLADKSGAVDWIALPDLRRIRRIQVGKTDLGVTYTQEGLAISGGKLWLLPEDSPSRLFAYRLPAVEPR